MMTEAIFRGDTQLVTELISSGIDVNHTDECGRQPLPVAVCQQNPEIVQILIEAGAIISKDVLFGLGDSDHFNSRVLKLLIRAGIEVDPTILEERETFLMQAAQRGELEAVKLLVEAGADVNRVDRENCFPLENAGCGKHMDVFEYLAPLTSPELRARAANQLPTRFIRVINSLNSTNRRTC